MHTETERESAQSERIVLSGGEVESVSLQAGLSRGEYQTLLMDRIYELRALSAPAYREFLNAPYDHDHETLELKGWVQAIYFRMDNLIDELKVLGELVQGMPDKKPNGGESNADAERLAGSGS